MSDDTSYRPTHRGVSRREGISAYKKTSCAGAGERAFASRRVLEDFRVQECANCGFSAKDSGFAFLIGVLEMTQEKQSAAGGGQGSDSNIGGSDRVRDGALVCG